MAINIEELLSELEGAEKTAEETFVSGVTSDESAEATEEKVAEAASEETQEETEEKVAEAEAETETEVEETEEKVAEAEEAQESEEEKVAQVADQEKELVKQAQDMGRIAAHSFYAELVAMGVMPATNKDMVVPPISSISMPSQSPVTVKADAMAAEKGQKKTASVVTPEFLTNLHNKIYSEE
jgi:archaellum component FlaD/FlaE